MSVRIAVLDPLPVYRRGMLATLADIGFEPEAPEDLLAWITREQRRAVLLTLETPNDWSLLAELRRASTELVVVAVLADPSVGSYVRALLAGAAVAVPRNASADIIRSVFEQAVEGMSVLPTPVVQALAATGGGEPGQHSAPVEEAELEWLRALAEGMTVARLAERHGYSERAMFRLLQEVYRRLGVKNRTEALMLANRRGWL
jgi:DNA-binding NarL/FixJ family response regulator